MFEYAPSVDLFGSFFPIWMICIAAASVLTLAARSLLIRVGIEDQLGPRLIVYPSMVTLLACTIWLVFFQY
ncbi:MAG: YtcA family lipoprotein [Bryobacteraceae bacterium]